MIKEACVETLEQCLNAEKSGADRLELCTDLSKDGLTPKQSIIRKVFDQVSIPVRVMIRPRPGDFIYSDEEIEKMKSSIAFCKEIGVEGVVFGICKPNATLDIDGIRELAEFSKPLKVTIHKAIDACQDPLNELVKLVALKKVDAVLSSGKQADAFDALSMLRSMIEIASDSIELIACGKITNKNIEKLDQELHGQAYHGKLIVGKI